MSNTNWALDPSHSHVGFKVKHLMFTNVNGTIGKYNVTVESGSDDFNDAQFAFTAEVNSISTGEAARDGHLMGADFFNAEKFPQINFKSTSFKKVSEGNYELVGNLTMLDVTKPVTLAVEYAGMMKDPWGNIKTAFAISGKINRKNWGLTYNAALETGGVLIGEEVSINAEIQMVKKAVEATTEVVA
ncbi:MAG TPA: YceI family protein [Bacteroidia bacterium]|nr:YceI family protein [Bacteroidia bacterium]